MSTSSQSATEATVDPSKGFLNTTYLTVLCHFRLVISMCCTDWVITSTFCAMGIFCTVTLIPWSFPRIPRNFEVFGNPRNNLCVGTRNSTCTILLQMLYLGSHPSASASPSLHIFKQKYCTCTIIERQCENRHLPDTENKTQKFMLFTKKSINTKYDNKLRTHM